MTTLLLARHGETDWNRDGRWQGHADPPLNDAGRAQARALAASLAGEPLDVVYSSDLLRARETAEILAAALALPLVDDPGLREMDVGSWSGLTRAEIGDLPYDGETKDAHRARVAAAVRRIARAHPEGRVLVVTHGGSVRRIHELVYGEPETVLGNCELVRIPYDLLGPAARPVQEPAVGKDEIR